MEKINRQMAEIEAFLKKNGIAYKYVDYKLKRGDNYEIHIICTSVSSESLKTLERKYLCVFVYPYTNHHISLQIDSSFL